MKKRLFGILLSFALMMGMMPVLGLSQTADADGITYNPASEYHDYGNLIPNDTEVTISEVSGKTWYVIAYDNARSTVTLLSKQSFGNQAFNSSGTGNDYATSDIKKYVDGLTGEGKPLAVISSVISDLTLIDIDTAEGLTVTKRKGAGDSWWLRSPVGVNQAAYVHGPTGSVWAAGDPVHLKYGVRPALELDLSKVEFDSSSNTFSIPTPKVTVKFDSDGGSPVADQSVPVNGKATKPADPTKDGYTFDGWYLGSTAFDFDSAIEKSITLTAHWKKAADKVTVKFNSAGGSAVDTQTIEKGAKATKPADPTRDGYTFDGWYLGDEEFDFDSPVEKNITLTAHWKKNGTPANMSTITFDLNGGTWEGMTGIVTMEVENGTVITLPAPIRDGYTFDYWEGSKYNAGDKYTVNGDHSFKAIWKTGAGGNGSKGGSSKKGVNTGDENTLGAWIVLLAAALTGTTGMAFARKRRND